MSNEAELVNINDPETLKNQGNAAWQAGQVQQAVEYYSKAIELTQGNPNATYYGNRANCYLHLKMWQECINDCDKAITLTPSAFKAYYRKGEALYATDRFEEALAAVNEGLKYVGDNDLMLTLQRECNREIL